MSVSLVSSPYSKLIQNYSIKDKLINKYCINLLLICHNKIFEIEKDEKVFNNLLNFKNILNLIYNDNSLIISENKFIIKKQKSLKFQDKILFNSPKDSLTEGNILCFVNLLKSREVSSYYYNGEEEQSLNNNLNITTYLNDTSYYYFDENLFKYYSSNITNKNNDNIFVILKDNQNISNISNIELKKLSDIINIENKNKYEEIFLKNNYKLIINIIKEEINKDQLNEKGIYFLLKFISKIINSINKEDIIIILKYILNYYKNNNLLVENKLFMSLEFIENKLNKILNLNDKNNKKLYKEKENNDKTLSSLFNYEIKGNILEINLKENKTNKLYTLNLINPLKNNIDYYNNEGIQKIYKSEYEFSNISFYKSHNIYQNELIKDNSILITQSLKDSNSLLDIENIIAKNNKIFHAIIANDINLNIKESGLINFINKYSLPIYKIENKSYKLLIKFYIEGIGLKKVGLRNDIYNEKDYILYFKLDDINYNFLSQKEDIKIEEFNPIYNANPLYKTKRCKNFYKNNGKCRYGKNCHFAHGDEELRIKEQFNIVNENEKKLEKYNENINNIYNEIINNSEQIFTLLNVKLIRRLIYDILCLDSIKLSEIEIIFNNMKEIVFIFELLCMEYYYNIEQNIPNALLGTKLKTFLIKISNKDINIDNNNWLKCNLEYFNKIEKNKIETFNQYLNYYNNSNLIIEKTFFNEYLYLNPSILYDKLFFLSDIIFNKNNKTNKEYFIKYYFEIINKITKDLKIKKQLYYNNYYYNNNDDSEDYFEYLFLSKIIDILYENYIKLNSEERFSDKYFISNNYNQNMINLIEKCINLDDVFSENNNLTLREDFNQNNKNIYLLIQYIYKYFDFCLLLFLRENVKDIFNYWINTNNKIFKYYKDYKILSFETNYKGKDSKEIISLIFYLVNENKNIEMNQNKIIKLNTFKMNFFNKVEISNKSELYNLELNNLKIIKNNNNYNKIALFCIENEITKKYIFQDIIDLDMIEFYNYKYSLKVNKDIYFVPLNNSIDTNLYSFTHKNYSINEESIEYNNLIKYESAPKYSWNIGFNGINYLLLSKEDNKIYNFSDEKETKFEPNNYINNWNSNLNYNNQIRDFIQNSYNEPSYLYMDNRQVFCINNNNYRYKWINQAPNDEGSPLKLKITSSIKIVSISATLDECYLIDELGKLRENKKYSDGLYAYSSEMKNKWREVNLPSNSKRFLQCACGKDYLLCLVEDRNGKGKIYAKGSNECFQCGTNSIDDEELNICQFSENLDFKYITTNNNFSAAITKTGELYVWGKKDIYTTIKSPILINNNENTIIVDKISIGYNKLFAIGRIMENGNLVKKLFSLEKNKENDSLVLEEVIIFNNKENNSRIIPIKIFIGEINIYAICINEKNFINEINENKNKDKINFESEISITYVNKIKNLKENKDLEKLKLIYSSDNCKFINALNSLEEKYIEKLIFSFNDLKKDGFPIEHIDYNELLVYLKGINEMNDLFSLLTTSEDIFKYLKIRISLVRNNFMKYLKASMSLNSESFLQKIIKNNIIYLEDNLRIDYFTILLLNNPVSRSNYNYRSIREKNIIINRFKANNFKEKFNENTKKIPDIQLNQTIFGQLYQYYKNTEGKEFFLEKGEKLFVVKLQDEDAIDQGGPYHEIFSCICEELQSDYIDLFIKTPNNKDNSSELRDKFIVNPNKIANDKAYEFIGKIMGLAISSGEALNLNLHPIIWKSILENNITFEEFMTIDNYFYNIINNLEEGLKNKNKELIDSFDLNFVIKNSNETDIELVEDGNIIKVTLDNVEKYINLSKSMRLNEFNRQIEKIKEGLFSVIEKNIIQILNWKQLEEVVCGKPKLDIEDFKKHTNYKNCDVNNQIIKWFWEWLETSKEEDQFKYLRFVSGRTRLSKSEYNHTINLIERKDQFPIAHTCFFLLDLPNYASKSIFIERIKYSIENCANITDG